MSRCLEVSGNITKTWNRNSGLVSTFMKYPYVRNGCRPRTGTVAAIGA
jgi:hypothetical protein